VWRAALAAAVVIIAAWATGVGSAAAAPQHNPKGKFLGLVHAGRGQGKASPQAPLAASNLTYHGGPVMHTNRTHTIYWEPSGFSTTSTYKSLINKYLADVAADSGKHSNVYASDVQYTDGSGNAAYNSTFAGSIVATDPYPASGCTDTVAGTSVCLSDAQIQAEVDHVVAAKGLPRGLGDLYLVMTPQGVGSCFGSGPSSCAYTDYCAYHSDFDFGAGETLYANQPYAGNPNCDSGEQPNGDVADSTINLISHEHNEAITDPLGTAWWDSSGNENGDKCAWNFGTALGGSNGSQHNQLINSGHYYLQQEWSNASHGCVLTMTNHAPIASFTSSPSSPATGQSVSFDGSASSDSDGTVTSYSWTFGDGTTGSGAKPTHSYATAASYTVKLTVTDNDGATGSVTHTITVGGSSNVPPSASFTFTPGSPTTGQSVALDGTGSNDPDGSVTGYAWNFGDGATGSGETTSHVYANAGTYTVTLTVTDNDGATGQAQHSVTVTQASSGAPPGGGTTTGGGSTAGGGVAPVFASPTTLPSAGLTAPAPRARVLIPSQRLILSSSRATTVRVTCSSRVRCAGTLRIYVVVPASAPRRSGSRTVLLGTARFSIAAQHSVTVRLRLVRLASTLLRDHVHVRVRTRAVVTQAAAGSAAVERSVWLERAPKPKR
jgi:PKD repeat protein